ncbi:hypothetical protein NDU88_010921 [Pleurodeles waltl]|uniref:Uncharacterized protein n=1 Tax=Pleurodeles waltl TaxID=8319 RepID=A0AAV7S2L4_PLEWA|nr:hypothetical protein NDU88_010921 [Pleurodeles waltl]
MLTGIQQDSIPTPPEWQPFSYNPERTQSKRRALNECASRTRRAAWRDVRVGDRVVVRDRCPGWKFSTHHEPGVGTVINVSGTMLTAEKGGEKVTRNVLWFRNATLEETTKEPLADDGSLDWPVSEGEGSGCSGVPG